MSYILSGWRTTSMEPYASLEGYAITRKQLEIGFVYVRKGDAPLFPSANGPVKIIALFAEDEEREIEVTYNPRYRRIHGLAGFYRKQNAQVGDLLEIDVLQHLNRYRFKLRKSTVEKPMGWIVQRPESPLVGPPINFRGLVYAPVNENGVIFLFSKVAEDLGITIEGIQVKFPDAFGKRYEGDKGYSITMEFEYRSSDYKRHGHPKDGCDLIICWEHNWKECQIQVIELKTLVKELQNKFNMV